MRLQTEADLTRLEELIEDIRHSHSDRADPLLEHLESARDYLMGGMPREYSFSLTLANDALAHIHDDSLRKRTKSTVESLLVEAGER
jgi:glutamate synthase domain-containing protein 3